MTSCATRWICSASMAVVLGSFGGCTSGGRDAGPNANSGVLVVFVGSLPTTAATDNWNVTLTRVITIGRDATAGDSFRPGPGNQWALFELEIQNRSLNEQSLLLASFRLVTQNQFEMEPEFLPSSVTVDRLSTGKLLPASRTHGFLLFELSDTDDPKMLVFDPSLLTTDDLHFMIDLDLVERRE